MSTEIRHYGEVVPAAELGARKPTLRIRCNAADLLKHWRRCGLSSDFGARYLSRFFVSRKVSKEGYTREAAEGTLSYVFNELVENCAKYSNAPDKSVELAAWKDDDSFLVEVRNQVLATGLPPFEAMVQEILAGDVEALYFKRLEENALDETRGSGLGYLTLMNDYGIRFGFRIEPAGDESARIIVHARCTTREDA